MGETLDVLASANAWWMDQTKLNNLILILKIDCSLATACRFAGITPRQYKYFIHLHPKFRAAVGRYQLLPSMEARMTIVRGIKEGDLKIARWYLARKRPEEFGSPSRVAKALKRGKIQGASGRQKEQTELFMDPEVRKVTEEYELKLRDVISRRGKLS